MTELNEVVKETKVEEFGEMLDVVDNRVGYFAGFARELKCHRQSTLHTAQLDVVPFQPGTAWNFTSRSNLMKVLKLVNNRVWYFAGYAKQQGCCHQPTHHMALLSVVPSQLGIVGISMWCYVENMVRWSRISSMTRDRSRSQTLPD